MQENYMFHQEMTPKTTESTVYLRPEQITVKRTAKNAEQNRNAIIRLAKSIEKYGILEPLTVKRTGESLGVPLFELISGERRLRAAAIIGLDKLPCHILPESHRNCAISGILEQIRQEGLHYFEQAAAFQILMRDFSLTQEEIARKSGLSQSAVANKLRLLRLTAEEQRQIRAAKLTERHARALLRLADAKRRQEALFRVIEGSLNVAATEHLVEILHSESKNEPQSSEPAPISVILSPQKEPDGVIPRKFALKDLTPLYNSIERSLSIFRKTGASATCTHEEAPNGVRIVINIPRQNKA